MNPIDPYDLMDKDWDEFIRKGLAELEWEKAQEDEDERETV
ncbi:hypothetical protein [Paenibacillus polymyxa]|nr:hypothetical protein [Paenibacillus polymyxa]UZP77207.1 hypothetical protein MF627_06760 [Paenibacillus polymyxa]